MVIGHNPGMEELVSILSRQSITMPTAAIAVLRPSQESQGHCPRTHPSMILEYFIVPKSIQPSLDLD